MRVGETYSHSAASMTRGVSSSRCRTVSFASALSRLFAGKVRLKPVVVALSGTMYSYDGPGRPVSFGTEIFLLAAHVATVDQPMPAAEKSWRMTIRSQWSAGGTGPS